MKMDMNMNLIRGAVGALFLVSSVLSAATVRVELIDGHKFSPSLIEVQVGDTVEFVNVSSAGHTVTADPALAKDPANVVLPEGAEPFHSGRLGQGDVFTRVFDVEGLYQYICLPHEKHMRGQIKVLPPSPLAYY